jgi:hypothetical protein
MNERTYIHAYVCMCKRAKTNTNMHIAEGRLRAEASIARMNDSRSILGRLFRGTRTLPLLGACMCSCTRRVCKCHALNKNCPCTYTWAHVRIHTYRYMRNVLVQSDCTHLHGLPVNCIGCIRTHTQTRYYSHTNIHVTQTQPDLQVHILVCIELHTV